MEERRLVGVGRVLAWKRLRFSHWARSEVAMVVVGGGRGRSEALGGVDDDVALACEELPRVCLSFGV